MGKEGSVNGGRDGRMWKTHAVAAHTQGWDRWGRARGFGGSDMRVGVGLAGGCGRVFFFCPGQVCV